MLIIIDGVDLTGKSTLAARLAGQIFPPAFVQHHAGKPTTGSAWWEYAASLDGYIPGAGLDLIVDRSFVSERVWPIIFSRGSMMPGNDFDRIAAYLRRLGAVHIHAFRPLDDMLASLAENPGEPLDAKQLTVASMLYNKAYTELSAMGDLVMAWDYDHCGELDVQGFIKEARLAELRASHSEPVGFIRRTAHRDFSFLG